MKIVKRLIKSLINKISGSNKYPHEIFPEILLWRNFDTLDDSCHGYYKFRGVMENGDCVVQVGYKLEVWSIHRLKWWNNYSLRERNIEKKMSKNNYTQFIKDFQKSYYEIKE